MGREVRRVPKDWQHPKDLDGRLIPLHDGYNKALDTWDAGAHMWKKGYRQKFGTYGPDKRPEWVRKDNDHVGRTFEDWYGGCRPRPDDYMPDWPAEERTHLQMYETCSEGTPISPVMETPEELARWLADNGASSFGSMTATYEQWLEVCRGGWAPSAVMTDGKLESGVAAMLEEK